jgi:hypothetical protein
MKLSFVPSLTMYNRSLMMVDSCMLDNKEFNCIIEIIRAYEHCSLINNKQYRLFYKCFKRLWYYF